MGTDQQHHTGCRLLSVTMASLLVDVRLTQETIKVLTGMWFCAFRQLLTHHQLSN